MFDGACVCARAVLFPTRATHFHMLLGQLRRGMHALRPPAAAVDGGGGSASSGTRPLLVLSHLDVPAAAAHAPGGEGLAPMVRARRATLAPAHAAERSVSGAEPAHPR